jgi:hypothetical protein
MKKKLLMSLMVLSISTYTTTALRPGQDVISQNTITDSISYTSSAVGRPKLNPLQKHCLDDNPVPPPFTYLNRTATPIDIKGIKLRIIADAKNKKATGIAQINFSPLTTGSPLLDLVYAPSRLKLNRRELSPDNLREIQTPDQNDTLRLLDAELPQGQDNVLEIEYQYPEDNSTIAFNGGGVDLSFMMDDTKPRRFLEQHAPANLEYDQFAMTVDIELLNAAKHHRLFTNGVPTRHAENKRWIVKFPDYFTSSSFYLHLTDKPQATKTGVYTSHATNRSFEVIVYSKTMAQVNEALQKSYKILGELEGDYGPFPHNKLIIYVEDPGGGRNGMEYSGATMTTMEVIGHELLHSWFGRGVMPANGDAGWIDEAIAYWRDLEYPTEPVSPTFVSKLSGFGPYHRCTPKDAKDGGPFLMSQLDSLFAGGLRPVLKKFFLENQRRVITTRNFFDFLNAQPHSGDLDMLFRRSVCGQQ